MSEEGQGPAGRSAAPAWYWAAAIGALLFELISCYVYLSEVRLTSEQIATLPLDQRALRDALPTWYYAAFGVTVWVGLVGATGLLLRKAWSEPFLLVSLIAMIIQYGTIFVVPELRSVSSDALLGPVIFLLIAYGCWQLAKLAKRKGWLS